MAQGPDFAARISHMVAMHNRKFTDMINKEKMAYPHIKILSFDTGYYFNDMITNPSKYHLSNVKAACYTGGYWLRSLTNLNSVLAAKQVNIDIANVPSLRTAYITSLSAAIGEQSCQKPDEYLFWDQLHPTRRVHQIIAAIALNILDHIA
jgi:phospholipase/lecithinase/hemolysin